MMIFPVINYQFTLSIRLKCQSFFVAFTDSTAWNSNEYFKVRMWCQKPTIMPTIFLETTQMKALDTPLICPSLLSEMVGRSELLLTSTNLTDKSDLLNGVTNTCGPGLYKERFHSQLHLLHAGSQRDLKSTLRILSNLLVYRGKCD